MALLNLTAFKETSTPNLISRWRVRYQAAQKFIFRIASRLLCCWGPDLWRLRENLSTDHICRVNFPLIVADADRLKDRIAAIVGGIRDDHFSPIRERGIDFTDQFSPVVANLHFQLSLTKFSLNSW